MNDLPQLSISQAMERIKGTSEGEVIHGYIETLKKKTEVVNLGTDQAFALRDSEGEIRAFKQNLHLSAANDGLVQPVFNGPFTISAQGYEMWAEAKGASVIFPRRVMVGSEHKPNPYVMLDDDNQRARLIYARAIAFCYSSKGLPQVVDWTTIYDVPSYRLIDLLAKARKAKDAFQLLPKDLEPETKGNQTWASYKFDGSTRFWINTRHEDAIKWYTSIINREKKAIDFAQTFARRNALKHLSGLQKPPGQTKNNPIAEWNIPVISWRPTSGSVIRWDAAQYEQLQENVVKMIDGTSGFQADVTVGNEQVESEEIETAVSGDPEAQAEEEAIDVTPQSVTTSRQPAPEKEAQPAPQPAPALTPEEENAFRNLEITRNDFPDEWAAVMEKLGLDPQTPTTALLDRGAEIFSGVSRMVDGG
jgi:hypothetical protein